MSAVHTNILTFKCIETNSISIDNHYGMFVFFSLTFISARVSEHEVPSDQ
jgi:hypothetical protein